MVISKLKHCLDVPYPLYLETKGRQTLCPIPPQSVRALVPRSVFSLFPEDARGPSSKGS